MFLFQYIGCLEVKESMRSLDFDTRTNLARYVHESDEVKYRLKDLLVY